MKIDAYEELLNKVILLETHVVIYYGALLHQAFWSGSTFKEVITNITDLYLQNIKSVK